MKLLDRYLFSIFGTAFLLVALTFVALFTAMDLSSRIARILTLKNINTFAFLVEYYLVRLPMFLHLILPAVSLFAAMFTVIQLQKTNELLPMITSGVSMRRLSLIFVAGALACAGLMAVLDEFVLPALMERIGETDDILISDKPQRNQVYLSRNIVWHIDEVYAAKNNIAGITITEYGDDGSHVNVTRADRGVWDPKDKNWTLYEGTVMPYSGGSPQFEPGSRKLLVRQIPPEGLTIDPPPTPDSFQRRFSISGRSYRFEELRAMMRELPHVSSYRMHMHLKFASPLGPLVLLFLGLPFVSGTQHRSFYRGIGLCLLLTVAYYAATFVCFELGIRGGALSPAAAVWGPLGVFGLAGLVSFLRMRS